MAEAGTFIRSAALAVAALLPIINPVGAAAIFLSMTPGASLAVRAMLARKIGQNAFLILVAAMLVGSYVLLFFGLSLASIKIAGGLLVAVTGFKLLYSDAVVESAPVGAAAIASEKAFASRGFYPLTFPLTIGPGTLSVALTIGAGTRAEGENPILSVFGTLVGLILVSVAVYLCFRYASVVLRALGDTGSVVLLRLSAFILLAVGIQIMSDGLIDRFQPRRPGRAAVEAPAGGAVGLDLYTPLKRTGD